MKFERIVRTSPPFDKRSEDPKKNFGVGGLKIWFILKGPHGATQILLGTKLFPSHVMKEWRAEGDNYPFHNEEECMDCWDVGVHFKKRPDYYEKSDQRPCDLLSCKKCYYDGSGLRGRDDKVVENYLAHGEKWIWEYLEERYYEYFPEAKLKEVHKK